MVEWLLHPLLAFFNNRYSTTRLMVLLLADADTDADAITVHFRNDEACNDALQSVGVETNPTKPKQCKPNHPLSNGCPLFARLPLQWWTRKHKRNHNMLHSKDIVEDILQPGFSTHARVTLLSRSKWSRYTSVKWDGIKLDYRPSFVLHSSNGYLTYK